MTMAVRKRKKKEPIGVLAPKPPKWENPQAALYMGGVNAPAGGFTGVERARSPITNAQSMGNSPDNEATRVFRAIAERLAATGPVINGGRQLTGGNGLGGATPNSSPMGVTGSQSPTVASPSVGMYSLPGYAPTDAQANALLQMFGGGGDGQTASRNPVASMIAALTAAYQRQMANLDSALSQAQTTGTAAADNALAAINANPSPYQNIQLQRTADQTNPLAAYMQALGTSSGQADATMGLINSMNQTQNAGLDQLAGNLNTINQNARQGSLNDIERSKQSMIQQLAMQRASEELAIKNYYSSRGVRV